MKSLRTRTILIGVAAVLTCATGASAAAAPSPSAAPAAVPAGFTDVYYTTYASGGQVHVIVKS